MARHEAARRAPCARAGGRRRPRVATRARFQSGLELEPHPCANPNKSPDTNSNPTPTPTLTLALTLALTLTLALAPPLALPPALTRAGQPRRGARPDSPLYLPHIYPISPLHLPYISPIPPAYLPHISPISPLYLPGHLAEVRGLILMTPPERAPPMRPREVMEGLGVGVG